jgi:hypothetical protein
MATDNKKFKSGTTVRACVCAHEFQDARYNGMRVHNLSAKGARCTVCGKDN